MEISTLKIIQTTIHYSLHFLLPFFISYLFYREGWKKMYLLFVTTTLVDLDHLLANPIFDPNRCSIGFHYFHSYLAIGIYFLLLFHKNKIVKVIAIGLLLHMATDFQDCLWNSYIRNLTLSTN